MFYKYSKIRHICHLPKKNFLSANCNIRYPQKFENLPFAISTICKIYKICHLQNPPFAKFIKFAICKIRHLPNLPSAKLFANLANILKYSFLFLLYKILYFFDTKNIYGGHGKETKQMFCSCGFFYFCGLQFFAVVDFVIFAT